MFGLSFGELLIIAVLALLLLGPDRLPEAAKTIGRSLRDLRRVTDDLKDQVEHELDLEGLRTDRVRSLAPGAKAGAPPPATRDNVPGLEAALAEPEPVPSRSSESVPVASPAAGPEEKR